MSLLKQINDKGAVLEWCPVKSKPNLVALGTKDVGSGFDDYGGELEIHSLNFSDPKNSSSTLVGKARANSRFASIAWSEMASNPSYSYGLIAGGMNDGYVHVWDPAKLASGEPDQLIASVEQHQGYIRGLQFNPHKESSHLLASGGADGEVYVMSLEKPDMPNVFVPAPPPNNAKHTAEITKVAWNTQVAHILASASQNGATIVWDLRQKKAWCELRDPTGGCVSDVAWNPEQGLHLVTSSGDDKNPVIKVWDLRSSTSLPLATLQGHTEGILSVSWCPSDPSLLLSCGKDNKTMMWDLNHLQPVFDLPSGDIEDKERTYYDNDVSGTARESASAFRGLASAGSQRRYHVAWSPCLPAVVSACSFDRKVQFYSLSGAKSKIGRAPKWLRKPTGATFGFGGKLIAFDCGAADGANTSDAMKGFSGSSKLSMSQVVEDEELVNASNRFHAALASGDYKGFCAAKASSAETESDRQVWSLMKVICFEDNARGELLTHLGFDSAKIAAAAEQYVRSKTTHQLPPPPPSAPVTVSPPRSTSSKSTAGELFDAPSPSPPPSYSPPPDIKAPTSAGFSEIPLAKMTLASPASLSALSPSAAAATAEMVAAALAGEEAEPIIRKALVIGNIAAAVDCCLEAGLMAEALLLAQCGDQSLWQRTRAAFFEKKRQSHPFLLILHAIIKNEMMDLVAASDLSKWKETLALLSTYGKNEEFYSMSEHLATRLEQEIKDYDSAALCFMCSANVARSIGYWTLDLHKANKLLGRMDTKALQLYVEKVVVFTQANPVKDLGAECSAVLAEYAGLLASQGRLEVAATYLKGVTVMENIMIDRLYNAGTPAAGTRPPVFPFEKVTVTAVKPVVVAVNKVVATGTNRAATGVTQQGQTQSAGPGSALPQGWIQLIDPTSSRPYFVNQATGVSQWDPPVPVPTPTPAPAPIIAAPIVKAMTAQQPAQQMMHQQMQMQPKPQMQQQQQHIQHVQQQQQQPMSYQQQQQPSQYQPQQMQMQQQPSQYQQQQVQAPYQQQQPIQQVQSNMAPLPGRIATSAFTPMQPHVQVQTSSQSLGMNMGMGQGMGQGMGMGMTQNQGQNQVQGSGYGISSSGFSPNPMSPLPNTSAPVHVPTPAPVAEVAPQPIMEMPDCMPLLEQITANLTEIASPPEKRQMLMVNSAILHLREKLSAGEVSVHVIQKLSQLVSDLASRNFLGAGAVQTDLANTVWNAHKEWLKGLKVLIQLAAKK